MCIQKQYFCQMKLWIVRLSMLTMRDHPLTYKFVHIVCVNYTKCLAISDSQTIKKKGKIRDYQCSETLIYLFQAYRK